MATNPDHDRIQTVPARVLAMLAPGSIQVILCPNQGLADGGIPRDIPLELVPSELRTPNTDLWVTLQNDTVVAVTRAVPNI